MELLFCMRKKLSIKGHEVVLQCSLKHMYVVSSWQLPMKVMYHKSGVSRSTLCPVPQIIKLTYHKKTQMKKTKKKEKTKLALTESKQRICLASVTFTVPKNFTNTNEKERESERGRGREAQIILQVYM